MYGFEPNELDPHNSIPNRVFKVLVRQNLMTLNNVMEKRVQEGLEIVMRGGKVSNHQSK